MVARWLKRLVRWGIVGGTLLFVGRSLWIYWPDVRAISLTAGGYGWLVLAGGITLVAHGWAGWVWHELLTLWGVERSGWWAVQTYLLTNVAKYLPGNVWHFYGRVRRVQGAGGALQQALASVIAEPLVMAVGALGVAAFASTGDWLLGVLFGVAQVGFVDSWLLRLGLLVGWAIALCLLRPRWLNPVLQRLSQLRWRRMAQHDGAQADGSGGMEPGKLLDPGSQEAPPLRLRRYPLRPLLGEMLFVCGRSLGFVATMMALTSLTPWDYPVLVLAFSVAWLLGLVVPGAPGGIGVFEASAIALLSSHFSVGLIVSAVACYRLTSTLAEVIAAALVWPLSKGLRG
ncbi:MAG: lysylphosphatidylglycerol synthase domain-containing protein [Cyanobacteria bacterium J06627_32]